MSDTSTRSEAGDDVAKSNGDRLTIRVMAPDQSDLQFKLRRTMPFKKLMAAFCSQKKLDPDAVRFMFDGSPVQENQTPEDLEMEDGDVLDAMLMQVRSSLLTFTADDLHRG